jgi:hypothetical protein
MGWLVYPHFGTAGITLQLGDEMNGFVAERNAEPLYKRQRSHPAAGSRIRASPNFETRRGQLKLT